MRLFVVIGGLIVAVLLTALLAPMFIDWGDYRARFEQEASALLGQPVRVAGDASARLLPFPSLSFTDVEVGPPESPTVTAERFAMDVELAPFLSGQVLIFDMRLESPNITLTLDENGAPIWPVAENGPINPAQVTLENASITDATVTVLDPAHDRVVVANGLDMTVSADSLYGPWRAQGAARINDLPAQFSVTTGSLAREGFALRVSTDLPNQLVRLVADGRIAPSADEGGTIAYAGTLTALPFAVDHQYRIVGTFSATPRMMDLAEIEAAFGDPADPYIVNGDAAIFSEPRPGYRINITGSQFDMTALADDAEDDANGTKAPTDLRTQLAALNDVLAGLPLPTVAGSVSVDLPTVVMGGTAIRDIRIEARPGGNGDRNAWRLQRLDAQLPGRTIVEADGELRLPDPGQGVDTARFDGRLVIASRQPTGLARWLGGDVGDTLRQLPNLGLEARIALSTTRQAATDVQIIAGETRLTGDIERAADGAASPVVSARFAGRDLDVAVVGAIAGLSGFGGQTAAQNADLRLDLDGARWGDLTVDRLQTEIRARGNLTEIDKLVVNGLHDAALSGTATIERLATGWAVRLFDVTVNGANGTRFAAGLAGSLPDFAVFGHLADIARRDRAAFDDMRLNTVGSALAGEQGDLREISATVSGRIGGSDVFVTTNLTGEGDSDVPRIDHVVGSLTHDDALRLATLGGLPLAVTSGADVGLNEPGALTVSVLRQNDGAHTGRIAFSAGGDRLTYEGDTPFGSSGDGFSGRIDVTATDIEPWLAAFGHTLPGTGLGTRFSAGADLSRTAEGWRASAIDAAVAESAITGAIALGDDGLAGPSLSGELTLDTLDAGLIGGILTGNVTQLLADTPFGTPLYDDVDVDLQLVADRLYIGDVELSRATGRLAMRGGLLTLDGLEARNAWGGAVTANGRVQNAAGTLSVAGRLGARSVPAGTLLPAAGDALAGALDIDLSLTGAATTLDGLRDALSGTGAVATRQITVDGLNSAALAAILPRADAIGIDITPEQVADLATGAVLDGVTTFDDADLPITIAGGVARAANLALSSTDGAMGLTGTLGYDLARRAPSADVTLRYDAGAEALAGMAAEVGVRLGAEPGPPMIEAERLVAFVSQRALENERDRVDRMQARLVERERLRRHMRYQRYLARLETVPAEPVTADDATSIAPEPETPARVEPQIDATSTAPPRAAAPEPDAPAPEVAEPDTPADPFSPQSLQRLIEALEQDRPR